MRKYGKPRENVSEGVIIMLVQDISVRERKLKAAQECQTLSL